MAFGQSSGPPATGKQVRELEELLEAAGHTGFRDARGPMGFNQRQAGGKFTRDEADAFIEQLRDEAESLPLTESESVPPTSAKSRTADPTPPSASSAPRPAARPSARVSKIELALRDASDEQLAAELQGRGWAVMEP